MADINKEEYVYCPKCRSKLEENSKFCPSSGTKIDQEKSDKEYEEAKQLMKSLRKEMKK